MATKTTKETDLAQLQTDVALLKQFNEKFVEPSLKNINQKLDSLQFVSTAEFEEHKIEVEKKFSELKQRSWVQNTVSAIFGAFLTIIVTYIIRDIFNK